MLEDEVYPCQELVSTVECCRIWNRLFVAKRVFQLHLDIWSSYNLESGTEGISRVITRYSIDPVGGGIHAVIAHQADQPRVEPILRFEEAARKSDRCGGHKSRTIVVQHLVRIMTVRVQSPELELTAELVVDRSTGSIKGLYDRW